MIIAISRFAVKNGKEDEVRAAFEHRPRQVEAVRGFLGLEVLQNAATFVLLTRWSDEAAFRSWHGSSEHHASHSLIPGGLKLEPSMTQLVVGTRIDGATSEGEAGELVMDLCAPLARLLRDGSTVQVAIIDADGRIVHANPAFARACGADPTGAVFSSLLGAASASALAEHLAHDEPTALPLQVEPPGGQPYSLRVFVRRLSAGFAIVGEPPWDDHLALEGRLVALNAELAVLAREHARQARLLEKANREVSESHWHLKKISEVLPMCMSCRAVKTGDKTWEEVSTFLARTSDFLSHGYCTTCAAALIASTNEDV